jgi:hypothetical protein
MKLNGAFGPVFNGRFNGRAFGSVFNGWAFGPVVNFWHGFNVSAGSPHID